MRKKFLAVALIFAIAVALCPATLAADSDFIITDGVLTSYTGAGGNVTIPDGVTSIGDHAFEGCTKLTGVTIPGSVTSIGYQAFYGCISLPRVDIPGSVTNIEAWAFNDCYSLTDVTLQNGVTSIGHFAFHGCTGLTDITIPGSVTSIDWLAFGDCTGLTHVTFQEGVAGIGNSAFEGCTSLTEVTIPGSVTSIGGAAFADCTGLKVVTIQDGVTAIGDYAFSRCTSLASVTIGDGVTNIGEDAFDGCTGLTSLTVAAGNPAYCSIDGVLFSKDQTELLLYPGSKAGAYTIPGGVTSIGYAAFGGCSGLTGVAIPSSVTSIGWRAFSFCPGLTSISVAADDPAYCSADGVLFNKNKTELLAYPGGKAGAYTVPDGVTSIGSSAFAGCAGLTDVTIPNSVTSIGDSAFFRCSGLVSVTMPSSVTRIGNSAFRDCTGLADVYYGGTGAQWKEASIQAWIPDSVTIHYNVSLVPAGQAASGTLESASSEALSWTYEADTVTVAEPIPEDEMVLVVCLDESGTFTDVKLLSADQLNVSIGQPDHFKLIWLGSSLAPQCEVAEVLLTP